MKLCFRGTCSGGTSELDCGARGALRLRVVAGSSGAEAGCALDCRESPSRKRARRDTGRGSSKRSKKKSASPASTLTMSSAVLTVGLRNSSGISDKCGAARRPAAISRQPARACARTHASRAGALTRFPCSDERFEQRAIHGHGRSRFRASARKRPDSRGDSVPTAHSHPRLPKRPRCAQLVPSGGSHASPSRVILVPFGRQAQRFELCCARLLGSQLQCEHHLLALGV